MSKTGDIMTDATRPLIALHALMNRHVWDDENDPETVYIQGHGLTTPQVEAIVREWFDMVDDGHTDGVAVQSWTEVALFDMADGGLQGRQARQAHRGRQGQGGSKVYATRARVTFGP